MFKFGQIFIIFALLCYIVGQIGAAPKQQNKPKNQSNEKNKAEIRDSVQQKGKDIQFDIGQTSSSSEKDGQRSKIDAPNADAFFPMDNKQWEVVVQNEMEPLSTHPEEPLNDAPVQDPSMFFKMFEQFASAHKDPIMAQQIYAEPSNGVKNAMALPLKGVKGSAPMINVDAAAASDAAAAAVHIAMARDNNRQNTVRRGKTTMAPSSSVEEAGRKKKPSSKGRQSDGDSANANSSNSKRVMGMRKQNKIYGIEGFATVMAELNAKTGRVTEAEKDVANLAQELEMIDWN